MVCHLFRLMSSYSFFKNSNSAFIHLNIWKDYTVIQSNSSTRYFRSITDNFFQFRPNHEQCPKEENVRKASFHAAVSTTPNLSRYLMCALPEEFIQQLHQEVLEEARANVLGWNTWEGLKKLGKKSFFLISTRGSINFVSSPRIWKYDEITLNIMDYSFVWRAL